MVLSDAPRDLRGPTGDIPCERTEDEVWVGDFHPPAFVIFAVNTWPLCCRLVAPEVGLSS